MIVESATSTCGKVFAQNYIVWYSFKQFLSDIYCSQINMKSHPKRQAICLTAATSLALAKDTHSTIESVIFPADDPISLLELDSAVFNGMGPDQGGDWWSALAASAPSRSTRGHSPSIFGEGEFPIEEYQAYLKDISREEPVKAECLAGGVLAQGVFGRLMINATWLKHTIRITNTARCYAGRR